MANQPPYLDVDVILLKPGCADQANTAIERNHESSDAMVTKLSHSPRPHQPPKKTRDLFVRGVSPFDRTSSGASMYYRWLASTQGHAKVTISNDRPQQILQIMDLIHDTGLAHGERKSSATAAGSAPPPKPMML